MKHIEIKQHEHMCYMKFIKGIVNCLQNNLAVNGFMNILNIIIIYYVDRNET